MLTGEGNTPAHRRNPSIDISAVGNLDEGFCRQRFERLFVCIFRVLYLYDDNGRVRPFRIHHDIGTAVARFSVGERIGVAGHAEQEAQHSMW